MATFTLRIDTKNDAFQPSHGDELSRILREVSEQASDSVPGQTRSLFDYNGNVVGSWSYR